jgi:DNA-binding NarL/FixJ family response regulator
MLRTYVRIASAVLRTSLHETVCDDWPVTSVLIVDDHPSFRKSARAVLEADGFDVVGEAEDGLAALAAVSEFAPDVVLLDVQLPDTDGFSLCEQICDCEDGERPSVVLVSSREAADYDGLIDGSRARGFISKADLSGESFRALLA